MTEASTPPSQATFKAGAELTIVQVGDAHRQLRALLKGKPEGGLYMDLTEMDRVDSAGIQLLVALAQEASSTGLPLDWSPPPLAVREAADALGLLSMLGFPDSTDQGKD